MKSVLAKFTIFGIIVVTMILGSEKRTVRADIYKYVDKNGVIHFTNVPTSSSNEYRLYVKEGSSRYSRIYSTNKYDNLITEASRRHGVSFSMVKAIVKAESDFNPRAVSKKGAKGLMQIMPENYKLLRIRNPFNPRENIMGGTRYFKQMLDRFNGKTTLALAAYNAGPSAVDTHKRIPPYKETRDYVEKVMRYYYKFRNN